MPTAFGPLHMTLRRLGILTAVTGCLLLPQWGMAQAPAKAALKRKTPVRFIRWQPAQNAFLLNKLAKDGDFGRAEYALDKLCDQTIANSRANQTIIIRRHVLYAEIHPILILHVKLPHVDRIRRRRWIFIHMHGQGGIQHAAYRRRQIGVFRGLRSEFTMQMCQHGIYLRPYRPLVFNQKYQRLRQFMVLLQIRQHP